MRDRIREQGFTLIELMIVVAIIAIIAAIAIPSILRSRMSANQTAASSSLKTVVNAESLYRQNDENRDNESNYWTENLYGLYGTESASGEKIKLFSQALADADYEGATETGPFTNASVDGSASGTAKSGYYFAAFGHYGTDEDAGSCPTNPYGEVHASLFGFAAFPEVYDSTGMKAYAVTQDGVVKKIDATNDTDVTDGPFNGGNTGTDNDPDTAEGTNPVDCTPHSNDFSDHWGNVGG